MVNGKRRYGIILDERAVFAIRETIPGELHRSRRVPSGLYFKLVFGQQPISITCRHQGSKILNICHLHEKDSAYEVCRLLPFSPTRCCLF